MGVGFYIFRKELMDTLRDRRTLVTMIVIPVLIFPVILTLFVNVSESFQKEAMDKEFKVGYLAQDEGNEVLNSLVLLEEKPSKLTLVPVSDRKELSKVIQSDSLQAGLVFAPDFRTALRNQKTGAVTVLVNETKIGNRERMTGYLDRVTDWLNAYRLAELNLVPEQITPLQVEFENTASSKETIGKLAGGILPYLFIAFGFIGCMYPAIDLFTGEKERGTIETLLTTPVPRWKILVGKMGVVVLSGLLAASLALFGLFLSIEVLDLIQDPQLLEVLHSILTPTFVVMLYMLLVPLTIFFAGIMIPIAVYAKTFKEAQSIITPLNIVVILPAMVGFFPGIELNVWTAAIPIVNVVLATKELIAGTLAFSLLFISFAVMVALAAIAVFISFKQFDKETNVVL
jgi:sodium transport system permease protein